MNKRISSRYYRCQRKPLVLKKKEKEGKDRKKEKEKTLHTKNLKIEPKPANHTQESFVNPCFSMLLQRLIIFLPKLNVGCERTLK